MTRHTSPVKGVIKFSDDNMALNGIFCLISETIEFKIDIDSSINFLLLHVSSPINNNFNRKKLICFDCGIIISNKVI